MWASLDEARADWPDAPASDATLTRLLVDATAACAAYAPALASSGALPAGYTRACVLHARELWSAARRDGDLIGAADDLAIRARPLTGSVRQLLRPKRGAVRIR